MRPTSRNIASRQAQLRRKKKGSTRKGSDFKKEEKEEELDDSNACYNTFTWGWPEFGALGLGEEVAQQSSQIFPAPVETFGKSHAPTSQVSWVACGGNHTLFVTKAGEVYACGRNQHGQLGLYDEDAQPNEKEEMDLKPSPIPRKLPGLKGIRFAKVSANFSASFGLTIYGELYSWGCGRYGVLGHGDEMDVYQPKEILALRTKTIEDISAGLGWHAIAIDQFGKIYSWGRNNYGQVGNGEKGKGAISLQIHEPHFGNTGHPLKIAAGQEHSMAMVSTKRANLKTEVEIFTWGNPGHGRLGSIKTHMHEHPQRFSNLNIYLRKKLGQGVKSIFAGGMHSMILTDPAENIVTWGCGLYGAMGYGFNWDQEEPQLVPMLNGVKSVACGLRHTVALELGGRCWTWGHNASGELGLGDTDCRLSPHRVLALQGGAVTHVAAGHYHTAILTAGKATTIREDPEYKRFFKILAEHGGLKSKEGRAVFMVLKKTLDRRGMNSELLKTPKKVLPGQPGSNPGVHKPAEPEFGFKYCLDTTPPKEDFSQRGSYETAYRCFPCKLEGICMACARTCHRYHLIEAYFRFRHKVKCGCSFGPPEPICKIVWSRLREIFEKFIAEDATILFASVKPILEEIRADKNIGESILEAAKDALVGVDDVNVKRLTFDVFSQWYHEFFDADDDETSSLTGK